MTGSLKKDPVQKFVRLTNQVNKYLPGIFKVKFLLRNLKHMNKRLYKMQNVSFKNVDEFLAFLPEDELKIVEFLRNLIFDCIPGCEEKLSYNVPYFRKHYNICFIWPASVTWGSKITHTGVRLGFVNGNLFPDEINFLDKGNRKQVYWKDFKDIKDIDPDLVRTLLFEAVQIDKEKKTGA